MRRFSKFGKLLLAALCFTLLLTLPSQAAKKKQNVWVTKRGVTSYYNKKGKKVTGLKEINNRYYYFDKNGVQRTGWRKIGNNYYYFRIADGKKGKAITSKTINGIKLDKNGKAVQTAASVRKLNLLTAASTIVDSITTSKMTKEQKLRKCFDYVVDTYTYRTWRTFSGSDIWDQLYAEDMFYRGSGNCFSYAAAFAYLAVAVGYKKVSVASSGGHGWAEIGGLVYDPDWSIVSKVDSYFAMSYDLSGQNGRPNYKRYRAFVITL